MLTVDRNVEFRQVKFYTKSDRRAAENGEVVSWNKHSFCPTYPHTCDTSPLCMCPNSLKQTSVSPRASIVEVNAVKCSEKPVLESWGWWMVRYRRCIRKQESNFNRLPWSVRASHTSWDEWGGDDEACSILHKCSCLPLSYVFLCSDAWYMREKKKSKSQGLHPPPTPLKGRYQTTWGNHKVCV